MEDRCDNIMDVLKRYGDDIAELLRIEKSRQVDLNRTYANAYERIYDILLSLQTEEQIEIDKLNADKEIELFECKRTLNSENDKLLKQQLEQWQSEKQQAVSDAVKKTRDDAQKEKKEEIDRVNTELTEYKRQHKEANDKIQDYEKRIEDYEKRLKDMEEQGDKLKEKEESLSITEHKLSEYECAFEKYIRLKKCLLECKGMEEKCKEWCLGDSIEDLLSFVSQVGVQYTFANTVCNTLSQYKKQKGYIPIQNDEIALYKEINQFYRELYKIDKDPLYMPNGIDWNQSDEKEFLIDTTIMTPSDKNKECKYANGVCTPCLRGYPDKDIPQNKALVRVKE